MGQKVKKGQILADGAATHQGELALGRNVLVAFMSWDGYNFEDAIIISERLVKNDTYTSIHIEEFDIEIRETKLGKEEFTRDIPNVSPEGAGEPRRERHRPHRHLRRPGRHPRRQGVARSRKSELTPEEKLLHAIFGRAGEDVKNDSLEVPSGVEGIVIATQRFSRRAQHDGGREEGTSTRSRRTSRPMYNKKIADQFREFVKALDDVLDKKELKDPNTGKQLASDKDDKVVAEQAKAFKLDNLDIRTPEKPEEGQQDPRPALGADPVLPRRAGPQAQLAEARRRAAQRRAADGEGLRRHQARHLGRRQDGRPARQQGRDLQDPARGGHAVPGGRHAGGHPAQPAGRAEPHERRPDPRDPPGLGGGEARLQGGHAGVRRRDRGRNPQVPEGGRAARDGQERPVRRPHRRARSSSR